MAQEGRFHRTSPDSDGRQADHGAVDGMFENASKTGEKRAESRDELHGGRVSEWPKEPVLKTGEP